MVPPNPPRGSQLSVQRKSALVVHSASQGSGASPGNRTHAPAPVRAHRMRLGATSGSDLIALAVHRFVPWYAPRASTCQGSTRRVVAEQQTAPDAAADEADPDSALGTTSPSTSSPPSVEATEDLMADERAEATMKHDMQLEVAAESMREAHTQLRLAGRLYDAKMARLDNSAMKSAVGWLERYYKAELAWRDAHIEHGAAEKVALEMKAEAKDFKLKFLERENARLRRLVPHA